MRIVITGAAGFVGSHLCERLVADGHQVVGIDGIIEESYAAQQKRDNVRSLVDEPSFALHEIDLRRDPLDDIVDGADAIVHLAAMPGLPVSWERLDLYTTCNLLATGRLIDAATKASVRRFVHVSTSSVYGKFAVGDESQPLRPASPYGLTKLAAENLLLSHFQSFGFPVLILRYFSIYGPRQRPDMAYHIFIESVLDGAPITVFGDGQQARSNTYVGDCVDATVAALDRGRTGEAYNVGGGELLKLCDAIDIIGELTGRTPVIERAPERPGDQRITQADTTKARDELGYQPHVAPRDGLARQLAWHVDRRALAGAGVAAVSVRG
jgi:nucleoside-diphosphate-sugar epimerase